MAEQHYAFIKDGRVVNSAVFISKDEELADNIAKEQGYDDAIWVGENPPHKWSQYDGKTFTPPTDEYLLEIGIIENLPITGDELNNVVE
jgi:hypothetical protein